jgi:spore coat protein U-like protein
MSKSFIWKLLVVAAAPLACSSVYAATATANMAVTASVSKNCAITTTPLVFGAYDPVTANLTLALTGNGTVSVACAKNSSGLTVGMSNGANVSGAQRQMKGVTVANTDFLQYDLFQPPSNTPGAACNFTAPTAWTDAAPLTLSTAPSKAARTYNVCGSIPGAQDVTVDSYTDTVTATINF